MARPDLNLLVTLDVFLAEGSVAGAARRLRLSPSAMSRALARLRAATGDPLLVRAGRGLVSTPRAAELRAEVARLVEDGKAVLRPHASIDLRRVERTFVLRTSDGFVESFGPRLIARTAREAPGIRLRFVPKLDKDSTPLRGGAVDLETGVLHAATGPEVRQFTLFRDRYIGVVRKGHPLSRGKVSAARYTAAAHISVSRWATEKEWFEEALLAHGIEREIVAIVGGFSSALSLARATDLVATVPARHSKALQTGMVGFPLPVPVPEITISLLWHPRMDADPAHRWLRGCVREICARG